jgi:hypothetical protein
LRDVSPEGQQWVLVESQRGLGGQLSDVVAQLRRQADSTFGGKTWVEVGWSGLGGCLQINIRALIELAERWGAPPQWVLDQRAAYGSSALGQLLKRKGRRTNDVNGEGERLTAAQQQ